MNAPHIGYYLHFPSNRGAANELVIGYYRDRYRLFILDNYKTPSKFKNLAYAYYDLSMPLLFWIDESDDTVNKIKFLDDIQIEERSEVNKGLYILSGDTNAFPYLQESAENVVSKYNYTQVEKEYIKLFIERIYLYRRIKEIEISNKQKYALAQETHIQKIKSGIEYVLNLDIDKVLSSLSVNVWDHHRTKIGGDDTYRVYQLISIDDKSIYVDEYLKILFQLGEKCIIEESGYTSYFPHPEITFGTYDEEHLRPIREEYQTKYSKVDHLFWYYQKNKDVIKSDNIDTSNYSKRIKDIDGEIESLTFNIKILHERLDERFFYPLNCSWEDVHKHVSELNEFLTRIQCLKPKMRVIISGYVKEIDTSKAKKVIQNLMDDLIRYKDLTLITGNANGGENISLNYALEKKITYVNGYTKWTMLGKDKSKQRYQEMAEDVDMICLIGDSSNYLYQNFNEIAKQKNIKVVNLTF